jgi:4-amino-4-deoxy-L-arabinose transferase-like glycosyltransferase
MDYKKIIHHPLFFPLCITSIFLLLAFIRFIHLDADPIFLKRFGDIGDEGDWANNARNVILFGHWIMDDWNSLAAAPLFSVFLFISFKLFGIGLFQDRLVSAIAGFLTLIILYIFINDVWSKKAALTSVIILGISSTFLMYNRLGIMESTMILFMVLTLFFWYKGFSNWRGFYLMSGLTFSLAILTKFTAVYFFPVIFLIWIVEYFKDIENFKMRIQIRNILYFTIGTVTVLSYFIIFYFIPNLSKFLPFLSASSADDINLFALPLHLSQISFNNLLGYPDVFLLLIPLLLYFISLGLKIDYKSNVTVSNIKKNLQKMNFIEIASVCWIIGGLLGVVTSDLVDRRFVMFIIPITILFTKILLNDYNFDFNHIFSHVSNILKYGELKIRYITYSLLLIPIYSFFTIFYSSIFGSSEFGAWIILLIFIIILVTINSFFNNSKKLNLSIILISVVCLFFGPFFAFLNVFNENFFGITDININFLISPLLLIIPLLFLFYAFKYRNNLLRITPKFINTILILYLVINVSLIGFSTIFPTFTIVDNSKELNNFINKGDVIIGPLSSELSFENQAYPLRYLPYDPQFHNMNKNITYYNPKYLLVNFKGESLYYAHLKDYPNNKPIKWIKLCPYPFSKKYKWEFVLYQINNS